MKVNQALVDAAREAQKLNEPMPMNPPQTVGLLTVRLDNLEPGDWNVVEHITATALAAMGYVGVIENDETGSSTEIVLGEWAENLARQLRATKGEPPCCECGGNHQCEDCPTFMVKDSEIPVGDEQEPHPCEGCEWDPDRETGKTQVKVLCANDPCETEAAWFYLTEKRAAFPLCQTCKEAFELGQVNENAGFEPIIELGKLVRP